MRYPHSAFLATLILLILLLPGLALTQHTGTAVDVVEDDARSTDADSVDATATGGPPAPWLSAPADPSRGAADDQPLRLRYGTFDPLVDSPRSLSYREEQRYGLIQFTKAVSVEERDALERNGVRLLWYIPDHAWVVGFSDEPPALDGGGLKGDGGDDGGDGQDDGEHGPADIAGDQALLSGLVRWRGDYLPEYRTDPALLDVELGANMVPLDIAPLEDVEDIPLDEQGLTAVEELEALGCTVLSADRSLIGLIAPGHALPAITALDWAGWVQPGKMLEFLNDHSTRILKARQYTDGSYKNDGESMWSYHSAYNTFLGTAGDDAIVAVVDSGLDGSHPAFDGRKVWFGSYDGDPQWTDDHGHGTHTAGTALGDGSWREGGGSNHDYAGFAPEAGLIAQSIPLGQASGWNPYQAHRDAVNHGANVTSNSWGLQYSEAEYDALAAAYDDMVEDSGASRNIPIAFSAGNDGGGPTISSPATAKNVITVGATDNNNGNTVSGFSSGGPVEDGRLKPDVMAPGENVVSCLANSQFSYAAASGTSMSCPAVGGSIGVIYDYYHDKHGYEPSPSMVKALLINGAVPIAGTTYPGNAQGWGRVNLVRTLFEESGRLIFRDEVDNSEELETDEKIEYIIRVDSPREFKVSLVWTDPHGSPSSSKNLVNDLDLKLKSPTGNTYYGNNFASAVSVDSGSPDRTNNVEGFRQTSPATGYWELDVLGADVNNGKQGYSLVVSGDISDFARKRTDLTWGPSFTVSPGEPVEGDLVKIVATVLNNGTSELPAAPWVLYQIDDDGEETLVKDGSFSGLARAEWREVSHRMHLERGTNKFRLELDPFNIVKEDDEKNNVRTYEVEVGHRDMELYHSFNTSSVVPMGSYEFPLRLFNKGTVDDEYNATVLASAGGWRGGVDPPGFTLSPEDHCNITVNVSSRKWGYSGDTGWVLFGVRSLGNGTLHREVNFTLTLEQVYEANITRTPDFARILSKGPVDDGDAFPEALESEEEEEWDEEYYDENGTGLLTDPEIYMSEDVVYPDGATAVNFTVTNRGNGPVAMMIYAPEDVPEGFEVEIENPRLNLEALERGNSSLVVEAPEEARAGESYNFTVTAMDGSGGVDRAEVTLEVAQVYAWDFDVEGGGRHVDPGTELEYTVTVDNLGNGEDTLRLDVTAPEGIRARAEDRRFDLEPGDSDETTVKVTIPDDALAREFNIAFNVSSDGADVGLEVEEEVEIDAVHGVSLRASPPLSRLDAGAGAFITLTVTNRGNADDTITLEGSGIPREWSVSYTENPLSLEPGEKFVVDCTVTTANSTSSGEYNITFTAGTSGRPGAEAQREVTLEVEGRPGGGGGGGGGSSDGLGGTSPGEPGFYLIIAVAAIVMVLVLVIPISVVRSRARKEERRRRTRARAAAAHRARAARERAEGQEGELAAETRAAAGEFMVGGDGTGEGGAQTGSAGTGTGDGGTGDEYRTRELGGAAADAAGGDGTALAAGDRLALPPRPPASPEEPHEMEWSAGSETSEEGEEDTEEGEEDTEEGEGTVDDDTGSGEEEVAGMDREAPSGDDTKPPANTPKMPMMPLKPQSSPLPSKPDEGGVAGSTGPTLKPVGARPPPPPKKPRPPPERGDSG